MRGLQRPRDLRLPEQPSQGRGARNNRRPRGTTLIRRRSRRTLWAMTSPTVQLRSDVHDGAHDRGSQPGTPALWRRTPPLLFSVNAGKAQARVYPAGPLPSNHPAGLDNPALSSVESPMALSTSQDGVLLRDGRPWRGYGVNYVDCFWRILRNPDDDSFRSGFSQLATLGIPFVRFAACGYWPRESELIRSRPADYWRRMDRVFNAAERNGIGLIPSLFWHYPTVPDLVGEPVGSLGEPKSLSRQWMARTIAEFAIRYRSSPALWAWEIGNETNLPADLPNASEHRPPVSVENGTPAQRSALDELSHRQVRSLLHFVASTIRRWDTQRLISSGNAFPRPTAWHQEREGSWGVDTEGQFIETLAADNPTPINSLGGRLYPEESGRFGGPISPERLLSTAMRAARSVRRRLGPSGALGCLGAHPRLLHSRLTNCSALQYRLLLF